jgi:acyl-CoA synthetase (AMP-forming)/AMP-acid ligase II
MSEPTYSRRSRRRVEEATITFRQLQNAALALAARLTRIARPGDRAILVFPLGLEFLTEDFPRGLQNFGFLRPLLLG